MYGFAMSGKITRMKMVGGLCSLAAALGIPSKPADAATEHFEVTHSDAEWKAKLSPAAYNVLRQHGTEYPGSSPLDHETRAGIYNCDGCELALFDSKTKFDSGTGWPSFYEPLKNAVETSDDNSMFVSRTEVHCRRCGGHLGHVFDDGPKPTGLRFCMNGVALDFKAAEKAH
jgi:peptide-methionine (R)-S-oxide reductase